MRMNFPLFPIFLIYWKRLFRAEHGSCGSGSGLGQSIVGNGDLLYAHEMDAKEFETPECPGWVQGMEPGFWYRISGDSPDLGLSATPIGTRYLEDHDPARDPALNYPISLKERVRRSLGRHWIAPWNGGMGFPAITEAWNGAGCITIWTILRCAFR